MKRKKFFNKENKNFLQMFLTGLIPSGVIFVVNLIQFFPLSIQLAYIIPVIFVSGKSKKSHSVLIALLTTIFIVSEIFFLSQFANIEQNFSAAAIILIIWLIALFAFKRKSAEEKTIQLHKLFESAETAVVGLDKNIIITAWNLGAERLYGISAKDAMGRFFEQIVNAEGEEKSASVFIRRLKDNDSFVYESVHSAAGGEKFTAECSVISLKDDSGKVKGYFLNIRNVTDKKTTKDFVESEERFKFISDNSGDIYAVVDNEGKFLHINPAFKKLLGYDFEALKNRTFLSLINLNDIEEHKDWKEFPRTELRITKSSGGYIWVEGYSHNVTWKGGDAVLIVCHDNTDNKRIQEAYIKSEKRFRLAVDNFPNAFIIYDSERRYQYINSFGIGLLGKSLENYFGKKDEEIFPENVTKNYLPQLIKCYETKSVQVFENQLSFNGQGHDLILIYVPYLNSKNEVEQVFSYSYDVSERKKAEQLVIAQKERTELLVEIFREISEVSLDYDSVLNTIVNKIANIIGDGCLIHLISNDGMVLNPAVVSLKGEYSDAIKDRILQIKSTKGPTPLWKVIQERKPILLDKVIPSEFKKSVSPEYHEILDMFNISGVIMLPLIYHSEVIGTMTLARNEREKPYSSEDLVFAEAVAHRAALAIGNSKIYLHRLKEIEERKKIEFQLKSQKHRTEVLAQLSKQFTEAGLNYSAVLDLIAKRTSEILGEGCMLHILSKDEHYLQPSSLYHENKDVVRKLLKMYASSPQKSDEGLLGLAVKSGEPIFIPYVEKEKFENLVKPEYRDYLGSLDIKSYMAIPLRAQGVIIGTMCVFRSKEVYYSFEEFDFAVAISDLAALAILNSRLYNEKIYEIEVRKHTENKLNEQKHKAETLYNLSKSFSEARPNVETVLNIAVEKIAQEYNSICIIHLVGNENQYKIGAFSHGNKSAKKRLEKINSCGICKTNPLYVDRVLECHTVVVEEINGDNDFQKQNCNLLNGLEVKSGHIISVPLKAHNKMIGVLSILRESGNEEEVPNKTPEDQKFLSEIGERIAYAVLSAQLHSDVISEVEERKLIEEALLHQQNLLKKVLETIPVGVWVVNDKGQVIVANDASEELWEGKKYSTNYFLKDYSGFNIESNEKLKLHDWPLSQALDNGETTINKVLEIECFTGKRKIILNSAAPIYDKHKKIIGGVSVSQDISDIKKIEANLKSALEELQRSNKELEQFAYVASHDLQEPVRMVNSFSKLLIKRYGKSLDNDAADFLKFITEGASRMQLLITDLLKYSRVGSQTKESSEVNLSDLLKSVISDLQFAIEESNAIVTYENLPLIKADPIQMRQVFQNLISNAIKFKNGTPPQIQISAEKCNGEFLFKFKDNGIGIAPEFYNKIFIIFQRLHEREKYPGTGIGLTVCKKIIERHGGKIWVESEPGKGSTFLFTIPE